MDPFEIIFSGDFGWGITYRSLVLALMEADGDDLLIKVSSAGGDVSEATAVKNALEAYAKKHNAKITFEVVGWGQSAMTYVMGIKGAKVIVHPDSLFMYHNPQAFTGGDHIVLSQAGNLLSVLTDTYAAVYAERSGKDLAEIKSGMAATTFLVGQEIIDGGFADEMDGTVLDYVAGGTKAIVAFGKQQFGQCVGRLAAAACGVDRGAPDDKNTMLPGNGKKKKEINMGDKKDEKAEEALIKANELRVAAWSETMQAAPLDQHDFLKTCFAQGKSADFFAGLQAQYVMQAEKLALEAKGDKPSVDKVPEIKVKDVAKPKVHPSTPGMTGEMVVV